MPPTFKSLSWFELSGARLKLVDDLVVGDRCLGGLFEARINARSVSYAVTATPADVVALALRDAKREPPAGLSQGHTDCAGLLNYRHDLTREETSLESLSLSPQDPLPPTGDRRPAAADPQACFADLVSRYTAQGKATLPATELPAFGRAFVKQCGESTAR